MKELNKEVIMSKRKNSGTKLSPKYGVNPTIPVCFWCGEDKNEVIILQANGS